MLVPVSETKALLKLYDNSVILDSAYYVGTLSSSQKYFIEMYKSGNKYESLLNGGDNKSTFNYLCLASFDNSNQPIDFKIIYYCNYDDILSYKRSFYIDNKLRINIKDFSVNEVTTQLIKNKQIKILPDGKFEEIDN